MKNNIAKYRIEKGYTQDELAKLIKISRPYLSAIENNKRNPTIKIATKIAKILEKSLEEIFYNQNVNHEEQDKPSA